jgi:hypothetical protein
MGARGVSCTLNDSGKCHRRVQTLQVICSMDMRPTTVNELFTAPDQLYI